ncbi:lipase family protein [Accumulibacter sp.]|uniref:lipase family protein n=1 Tax=Accumulibacter sp. TaxID=2053492 RepID=UPI00287898EA|nr:hypothetical protein [Accumulibacter sp.]MDS4054293.1 hypothetical protein [Accumulibacter sp.]
MMTNSTELIKTLLVACDQSYFTDTSGLKETTLQPLPDCNPTVREYQNHEIYRDILLFAWDTGYKITEPIDIRTIGAKALVYFNPSTRSVIVAFAGTDGTSLQDWVANTQSLGWSQWKQLRAPVLAEIARLQNAYGPLGTINFTGQSLGGALAQYAAYEYVERKSARLPNDVPNRFDKSKVTLTTFNGLGAVWGLQANGGYDASVLAGIGFSAHYVVANDLVARLGGGHIGADGRVVYLGWTYNVSVPGTDVVAGNPMDIADAHRIETAFYTHPINDLSQAAVPEDGLLGGKFLLNVPGAVKWAGAFGGLLNDETLSSAEALFRLLAGLAGSALVADPTELNTVAQAAFKAQYDAGKMRETTYAALSWWHWGWLSKAIFLSKPGLIGTGGSLFAAAVVKTVEIAAGWLNRAFRWLRDVLPSFDATPEPAKATSPEEAALKLLQTFVKRRSPARFPQDMRFLCHTAVSTPRTSPQAASACAAQADFVWEAAA